MRSLQTVAACVLALTCAWGPAFSAQTPQAGRRILIVADELSLQFRSTPWTRELISRILRVLDGGDVVRVVLTGGAPTLFTRSEFDAVISGLAQTTQLRQ